LGPQPKQTPLRVEEGLAWFLLDYYINIAKAPLLFKEKEPMRNG
jgi:hypothetical protein